MLHFSQISAAVVVIIAALIGCAAASARVPDDLPEAERSVAHTVDPWGLPFGDQLTRFRSRFASAPEANFCVGLTNDLVKIWPDKYWFQGPSFPSVQPPFSYRAETLWAAAGTTAAFQIVVLPRIGAPAADYQVAIELDGSGDKFLSARPMRPAPGQVTVFREVFVLTAEPAYPRYNTDRWPDPLVPEHTAHLREGRETAVFWIDVALPMEAPSGRIECPVMVTDGEQECRITVPLQVVGGLDLRPKDYPFIGWFNRKWGGGTLSEDQYRGLCDLVLAHHMVPVDALKGVWNPGNPEAFDEFHHFLAERGQRLFDLGNPESEGFAALYQRVKQQGWLEQALVYGSRDEPDDETFAQHNIPAYQAVRQKYPGLRVYLASEWHENMGEGSDIWMTDISSARYDPEEFRGLEHPELWHYYCHLPIRWQMRAPLALAPNMQIDNPALEHRLALWMSRYYGARGVFIWAGFVASDLKADFWETLRLSTEPSHFPYAGIHNGNNFRVYPPREAGGPVLPSLRLKVTRAGLEDLALLQRAEELLEAGALSGERAERLRELLDPAPEVFVNTHYFNRDPQVLLQRREAILRTVAAALQQ